MNIFYWNKLIYYMRTIYSNQSVQQYTHGAAAEENMNKTENGKFKFLYSVRVTI